MAERGAWLSFLRQLVRLATLVAVAGLVIEFGLPLEPGARQLIRILQTGLIGLFVIEASLRLAWAPRRGEHLRREWLETALLALIALDVALAFWFVRSALVTSVWFAGVQVYLVARFVIGLARVQSALSRRAIRPPLLLIGGYVLASLGGALLLLLPLARAEGAAPWSFTDAFFTATSAVCVTGLTVRDVGSELSFRGQALLLGLIQLGGLGIVLVVCSVGLLERGRPGVREMRVLGEALGLSSPGRMRRLLAFTLVFTLCIEALGTLVLWLQLDGTDTSGHERLWCAAFHSVSAFCNAGFGLFADSLAPWAARPDLLFTMGALIVLGGLGFTVHMDLLALRPLSLATLRWLRWRLSGSALWPWRQQAFGSPAPHRLTLSSRLVLATSALLVAAGTVLFLLAETGGALADRDAGQQWIESLFQSVTLRTAGFSTLDFGRLGLPILLAAMALMAVGASPLSTGGGVKTTTLAVAALTMRAMTRNREQIDAFGRSIPRSVVHACIAIVAFYAFLTVLVTAALLSTQAGVHFEAALFESVSALSTVGLSTGLTPRLDVTGRWIVAAAMIAGRIGPLACLWTFVSRPQALRYRFPEEQVIVS